MHAYAFTFHTDGCMSCSHRRSLEAKAALYDRLSKGEGLRELVEEEEEAGMGEGQHRYMVDFTKKAVEVNVVSVRIDQPKP